MSAESGTGVEGHESERLGFGRIDDLPHVNAHGGVDDLELVDQGDVDAAEGVFEQLGRLGHPAGDQVLDRQAGFHPRANLR